MADSFEHCAKVLEHRALEIICSIGPQSTEEAQYVAITRHEAFNEAAALLRALPLAKSRRSFLARLAVNYRARRTLCKGRLESFGAALVQARI